ncbi:GNAT family N-acetyltransferase [Hazenella coriacea]|uniref:Ribosomal protein S18 acetylase RimI-like enzyme n=1 Tax=Hazenella coriacea TaxID=1179467 RepID=A0A4R3LH79_9BACL|nr:GNAT family N-acetyltransferase [Hazenella coriacea]TCS96876.1 ribosomal protein S18 acetylase RimI-like enzyme [Hazenella coriacea]
MEIRASRSEDMKSLMDLNHLIWNETNTPQIPHWESVEKYEKAFPAGSQHVAIVDQQVAGCIRFHHPLKALSNQHVLELDIGIHPHFQGKGIGSALLNYVYEVAQKQQIRKLSLRVLSTNHSAISFYKKNGFTEQGRLVEEFFINGRYVDDILMYKLV